jgi:small conductance mechanosensitive channel
MPKDLAQLDRTFEVLIGWLITYSFQIIGGIAILLIGLKLSSVAARLLHQFLTRRRVDATLARFLSNVSRIVLLIVVAVIVVGQVGINVTPLVAAIGAATLGISVALQGVLSNYAAGVTVVLTRPFRIGDTIRVRGVTGLVEDITLPATVLRGEHGERISIPNRQIVGEILVNSEARRIVETHIVVPHDADLDQAIAVLQRVLEQAPTLAGAPAAELGVLDFAIDGPMIGVRYWAPTRDYFPARFAVNAALRAALIEAKVPIVGGSVEAGLRR